MKPREIKARMRGLEQTVSITRAMQTVAAAKIAPSQAAYENACRYRDGLKRCFDMCAQTVLPTSSIDEKRGLLVVSAERGLCGGYNAGIRTALQKIDMTGVKKVYFSGRRAPLPKDVAADVDESFLNMVRRDPFEYGSTVAATLADEYERGEIDSVYVLYYDCENSVAPVYKRILPFERSSSSYGADAELSDTEKLFKQLFAAIVYSVLASATVVENITRMSAMKFATTNGDRMLDELSVVFNQTRQNEITSELNDTVNASRSKEI